MFISDAGMIVLWFWKLYTKKKQETTLDYNKTIEMKIKNDLRIV